MSVTRWLFSLSPDVQTTLPVLCYSQIRHTIVSLSLMHLPHGSTRQPVSQLWPLGYRAAGQGHGWALLSKVHQSRWKPPTLQKEMLLLLKEPPGLTQLECPHLSDQGRKELCRWQTRNHSRAPWRQSILWASCSALQYCPVQHQKKQHRGTSPHPAVSSSRQQQHYTQIPNQNNPTATAEKPAVLHQCMPLGPGALCKCPCNFLLSVSYLLMVYIVAERNMMFRDAPAIVFFSSGSQI